VSDTNGRDLMTVKRAGSALLARSVDADRRTEVFAATLPAEPATISVVVDHSAVDALRALDPALIRQLGDQLAGRRNGIRLITGGAAQPDDSGAPALAAELARRLDLRVTAPEGPLISLIGGELFSAGPGAGWLTFAPDGPGEWSGPRYPAPSWQAAMPRQGWAQLPGRMLSTATPAGLWLRAPGGRLRPRSDRGFGIPVQPERPIVLIGADGEADPGVQDLADLITSLPPLWRDTAVLAPYECASPAWARLAQKLADRLGRPIRTYRAMPYYAVDGSSWIEQPDAAGPPERLSEAVEDVYQAQESTAPASIAAPPSAALTASPGIVVDAWGMVRPRENATPQHPAARIEPAEPVAPSSVIRPAPDPVPAEVRAAEVSAVAAQSSTAIPTMASTVLPASSPVSASAQLPASTGSASSTGSTGSTAAAKEPEPAPADLGLAALSLLRSDSRSDDTTGTGWSISPEIRASGWKTSEVAVPDPDVSEIVTSRMLWGADELSSEAEPETRTVGETRSAPEPEPELLPSQAVPAPAPVRPDATPPPQQPLPVPVPVPVWLTDRPSTEAERLAFRTSLGPRYDAATRAVARLLAESPGLRGNGGLDPVMMAELAAVRVFTTKDQAEFVSSVRESGPGCDRPFAACVAAGLRRLPTFEGVVVRGGPPTAGPADAYHLGQELTEPAPMIALDAVDAAVPGAIEVLIWSVTARRLTGLAEPSRSAEVAFLPGTVFQVLAVDPAVPDTDVGADEVRRVLLAEVAQGRSRTANAAALERIRLRLDEVALNRDGRPQLPVPGPAGRFGALPGVPAVAS
jgi:hypothetical protein